MASFVWRLQRVLDIRQKEEQVLRSELMALGERISALKQQIMAIRNKITSMLQELAALQARDRLEAQQMFMKHSEYSENQIKLLRTELEGVDMQRKNKMKELLEKRQEIKGLEKLREKDKEEYLLESAHKEQQLIDEYTNNKFGRIISAGI